MQIKLDDIILPPSRQRENYTDIRDLCRSLQEHGQLQNIVVESIGEGKYMLIIGGRRYHSAQYIGWKTIEASTRDNCSELERKAIELEENVCRKDLTIHEQQKAVRDLYILKKRMADEAPLELGVRRKKYTQEDFAIEMRMTQPAVSRAIKIAEGLDKFPQLLDCPTIKETEQKLRRLMIEEKTGASMGPVIHMVQDFQELLLSLPERQVRCFYSMLGREEYDKIQELDECLQTSCFLFVEPTDVIDDNPFFNSRPIIINEKGMDADYKEVFMSHRGKDYPYGTRVISVDRDNHFLLPHSHAPTFWEKILPPIFAHNINEGEFIGLNCRDFNMLNWCHVNRIPVTLIYTNEVFYKKMRTFI
jgi:ParB/RepB/Spo0J family partition protein